jgi:hypothetical protein
MTCYRPGARSRFCYRIRVHTGRKGQRRSMSEAGHANLITASHHQLAAPLILEVGQPEHPQKRHDAHVHPGRRTGTG